MVRYDKLRKMLKSFSLCASFQNSEFVPWCPSKTISGFFVFCFVLQRYVLMGLNILYVIFFYCNIYSYLCSNYPNGDQWKPLPFGFSVLLTGH